jgi:adenylyltransferase/sulfurtransferase
MRRHFHWFTGDFRFNSRSGIWQHHHAAANPNSGLTLQLWDGEIAGGTGNDPREIMINGIAQITVNTLKERIDKGEDVFILDVREPFEYQIANIGGKLIPQNDVPKRLAEIPRDREIVVHCKTGGRSQRIAEFLHQSGYPRVANVSGGIFAWADQIDPSVKKY